MRKSTIVVALLAATVASAEASPNSRHLAGGSQVSGKSQARVASTAAQTRKSERQVNAVNAASVPSAAARGAAAFTSARNAGAAPAAQPQAAALKIVAQKTAAAQPRVVTRSKQARAEARAKVREATARRLARKSETVALTREVPVDRIEKPAGDLATNAPTGSIKGMVTAAAKNAGVDPALGHAVVKVESMYQPKATGKGGYIGLMQLSYQTARGMGFRGSRQALYEPSANLQYGMRYLAGAVRKAGGSTCGAVSKYQGGHAVKGVTPAGAVYCAKVRRYMASAN
jgi:soluble lytic murein transglycosylase-like protein